MGLDFHETIGNSFVASDSNADWPECNMKKILHKNFFILNRISLFLPAKLQCFVPNILPLPTFSSTKSNDLSLKSRSDFYFCLSNFHDDSKTIVTTPRWTISNEKTIS